MAVLSKVANIAVQPQPVGVVEAFAGTNAPNGWLICDGSQVLRSLYPELFSVIGTTYGSGDGSSTFTLPDLRGRTIAGRDGVNNMNNGPTNRLTATHFGAAGTALGNNGGSESNTLTTSQMPSHTHTQDAHGHTLGGGQSFGMHFGANDGAFAVFKVGVTSINGGSYQGPYSALNTTATNQNTGGGNAHNNTQPTMILNYIIKAVSELPRGGWYNSSSPDLVTSLPTNPYNGQEVVLVQTVAGTTYHTAKRYDGSTWRSIGPDPAITWTNVTSFSNDWSNYGGGWATARYTRDNMGVVFIEGLVRAGTIGTTIFTLPVGYRPTEHMLYAQVAGNQFCRVDVLSDGSVIHRNGGTNEFVSLSITFKASQ